MYFVGLFMVRVAWFIITTVVNLPCYALGYFIRDVKCNILLAWDQF